MVKLLSGGNPQIPKGDGDEVVQQYIAACPEWKSDVAHRLDALISEAVPGVEKAVRWNSPFYGAGQGWFVSYHCFTKYVKVTFFMGSSLAPKPPVKGKDPYARYYHVHEDGEIDEKQFEAWVKQAAKRPAGFPKLAGNRHRRQAIECLNAGEGALAMAIFLVPCPSGPYLQAQ